MIKTGDTIPDLKLSAATAEGPKEVTHLGVEAPGDFDVSKAESVLAVL